MTNRKLSAFARRSVCPGFTLVELLVVIAIIGVLIALLLPAVQAAREAARATQCKNNLKQVGLAAQTHLNAQKTFPTGGWGYQWLGDPDRGFGVNQPGGWGFTLLPFIEESSIYNLGKGLTGASKQSALAQMSATPAPFFSCPSRRAGNTGAVNAADVPFNAPNAKIGARSDYAGNAGTYPGVTYTSSSMPPAGSDTNPSFIPATWFPANLPWWNNSNGVIFAASAIGIRQIPDGVTKTYLFGEKFVQPKCYDRPDSNLGDCPGDNGSIYEGHAQDTLRWAASIYSGGPIPTSASAINAVLDIAPQRDANYVDNRWGLDNFGSAHLRGTYFVMCDGSVQTIPYLLDQRIHWKLANRMDSLTVDLP
ncbi:MAG TPA: DUF1559 domain-containing protein [Pirellulales bacterium]